MVSSVHGNTIISRKKQVKKESDYSKYTESLREDFGRICGYCGKNEVVAKSVFEIDHFIPVKIAPEMKNDYSNLVYCCQQCNRKKAGKWPSGDKNIQFIDGKGFVDPATDEFDEHLERTLDGNIIGKTIAGKYMVEEGFKFNIRPIKEIYKAMLLIEKKCQLEEKIKILSDVEKDMYIEFSMALNELEQLLFDCKE